ncbi:MAG: hypothetical protein J0I86_11545 [Mesorhizobium sp.]|nr:hypothetical protein [Mesorhizobium sp.]
MTQTIMIEIFERDGKRAQKSIEATVIEGLAVHAALGVSTLDGKPSFSVTHIASGRKVTPLYFEDEVTAEKVAALLVQLPVDWTVYSFADDYVRQHVKQAVLGISALFGGFLVDSAIDQPSAGSA